MDIKLYTLDEVTALLRLKDPQNRYVRKQIEHGALVAVKVGRLIRVSSMAFSRFLDGIKTREMSLGRRA